MYLLTKPETLNDNVSISLTGVTDASKVIDGKLDTFVETPTLAPILTIDLGSAKQIDAVFLKGENLQDYDLKASNNNSTFTDLATGYHRPRRTATALCTFT